MKKEKMRKSIFDRVMIVIGSLVTFGIAAAISLVIIKGFPYLLEAIASKEVRFAIQLSVYTASVSTVICIILAVPTAYALAKTAMPFRRLAQMIIEMPLSLPYLVVGLSLLLVFSSDFGKWLGAAGYEVAFSKKGIIMAHIMVNLPFMVRMLKTAFESVDDRLEFIARTLGATKAQSFFTITLPMSKKNILGTVVLSWSRALGEFGATLMLVGMTRMKTETLPASIYLNMSTGELGPAMASAVILLVISAVSLLIFNSIRSDVSKSRIHLGM